MALYKVQSPINSALQGMQNASATTAGMTKKQEVKEPKKSFGGALGSMIAGGSYGLGMADMGERLAAPLHHLPLRNQWRMPGALPQ